jgi:hypothetical protein
MRFEISPSYVAVQNSQSGLIRWPGMRYNNERDPCSLPRLHAEDQNLACQTPIS